MLCRVSCGVWQQEELGMYLLKTAVWLFGMTLHVSACQTPNLDTVAN